MSEEKLVQDETMDVAEMVRHREEEKMHEEMKTKDYKHGDYVEGKDGMPGGILIDHDEEIRKMSYDPQIDNIKKYLDNMDQKIADAQNNSDTESEEKSSESEILANLDRMMEMAVTPQEKAELKARKDALLKVQNAYADYEMTANGLEDKTAVNHAQPQQPVQEYEPAPQTQQTQNYSPLNSVSVPEQPNVVQFNVQSQDADRFLTNLNPVEREKVVKSDTLIVNEIKSLDIPVATRTITSLNEFKKVLPRQSHSGVIKTPNINSGYSASFKGCGALALATIIPDESGIIDWHKRFALCYDNLVDTSIGKLSFNDFCARTHINDLPNMLFAILRASDPDENMISLECAGCGRTYEQKYKLSELLDLDSITDDMSERIDEIMSNESIKEKAMEIHQASPVMTSKYVQFDQGYQKVIMELKAPNATTFIEITPHMTYLIEKYSKFVAGILPYIAGVYLIFTPEGSDKEETYHITDVDSIAEILRDLDKTCIQAIGKTLENVKEYDSPTYSFKGSFKCPHCGRLETKIPCTVDSLIFYKVEQAIL